METQGEQAVRQVLHGLRYPAERWQVITQAEMYGADIETRTKLHGLPIRRYRSSTDVSAELADQST